MIQDVRIRLYADPELTVLKGDFPAAGTTSPQDIDMDGLDSNTLYYAVGYATDDHGVTGHSSAYQFTTLASSVVVTGDIAWTNVFDTLKFKTSYTNAGGYTLVAQGIQVSTDPMFAGTGRNDLLEFFYTGDGSTWQNISTFRENTLYYYRYFAEFDTIGRVYGQPPQNTITTMYAPPVFTILPHDIGSTTAAITVSYSGNYPIDYNTLRCVVSGQVGDWFDVNLDRLTPSTPVTATFEGMTAGVEYEVEVYMNYYNTTAESYTTFQTEAQELHNFDFDVNVSGMTWNSCSVTTTATEHSGHRLTVTDIGIDISSEPDFSGHNFGGHKGSAGYTYTLGVTQLNSNRMYYYRPWISTEEYGREYGQASTFVTLYEMPVVSITQSSVESHKVVVNVAYSGQYPVPSNGVVGISINGVVIQTKDASRLVRNSRNTFTFDRLDASTNYVVFYSGAYYDDVDGITASLNVTTAARVAVTHTDSWAKNGQHTDVFVITTYALDEITYLDISHNGGNISEISRTVEGDTYTIVTVGYEYGTPVVADVEIGLNNETYTTVFSFNIVVPAMNLEVQSMTRAIDSQKPCEMDLWGMIRQTTEGVNRFNFDFDLSQCQMSIVQTESGTSYTLPILYTGTNGNNWTVRTGYIGLPAGTYQTATFVITNVVGQTETTTVTSLTPYEFVPVKFGIGIMPPGNDMLMIRVGFNPWYDWANDGRVVFSYDRNILQTTIPTNKNDSYTYFNLASGTEYTVTAYYGQDYEPMSATFSTTGTQPLWFKMPDGGNLSLTKTGSPTYLRLQYSINGMGWQSWLETNDARDPITLSAGDTVFIRDWQTSDDGFSTSTSDYYQFSADAATYAGGNTMTLMSKYGASTIKAYCFANLFRNFANLLSAPQLPATTGATYCYYHMFRNTGIVESPEVFLEVVNSYACRSIFQGCTNLVKATVHWTRASAAYAKANWLYGVADHGVVICPAELTDLPNNSDSGIPTGWTRQDLV